MQTECSPTLFEFEPVERHKVVAGFDGGIITSDAGGLLLGRLDRGLGVNGGGNMYRRGGAKMYHGLGGSLSA